MSKKRKVWLICKGCHGLYYRDDKNKKADKLYKCPNCGKEKVTTKP